MPTDETTKSLYQNPDRGLTDLGVRLRLNTQLGNLDLEATLADNLGMSEGMNVLDVGCGTARHLAMFIKKFGIAAYGIDPSPNSVPETSVKFVKASADSIPFIDGSFDRVMCNYAMYYVKEWEKALHEMLRVVKKEGVVLVTGPGTGNNNQFYGMHRELFGEISSIDKLGLEFIDLMLIPFLVRVGYGFRTELHTNHVVYSTVEEFVSYYCSTSLFRMTLKNGGMPEEEMVDRIMAKAKEIYASGSVFANDKKVRILTLYKP